MTGRHHAGVAGRARAGRFTVRVALLAAAVALIGWQATVRGWEALAASSVLAGVGAVGANPAAAIAWFQFDAERAIGLQITPECSAGLVLVPVLVLGAMLAGRPHIPMVRVAIGLLLAVGIIVGGNLARVGAIAAMIDGYGVQIGYDLGHTIVGSLISLVFVGVAMVVLIRSAAGGR